MEQTQAIIKTEGLCRTFSSSAGEVQALRDVTLEVRPRCLSLLNGKSGSGKTTLINLLGSLDRPTSGRIFFEGQELTALPERARDKLRRTRIGFVFQSVALMGSMTAYENVEFGLRVAGFPAAGRRERALECLDYVGLSKRAGHLPQEMSGGEQQRVAIARALINKPEVLLADEPTGNLDPQNAMEIMRLLDEINRQGTTVIVVTHSRDLVNTMQKRVITIEKGVVVSDEEESGYRL